MKPCSNIDFITGKRCPNRASALPIIDEFINRKIWNEIRPAMSALNEVLAKFTKIVDTNSARVKELNNEKKDINKKLDNLLDLQLAKGVDQRLIDKENQLKYRLQQIEEQLDGMETETGGKNWVDMFFDLHKDFIAGSFKWKSKDPSIRNTFLKKYIDRIVYTKNNIKPDEPKLETHYTEKVNQAIYIYKQYKD